MSKFSEQFKDRAAMVRTHGDDSLSIAEKDKQEYYLQAFKNDDRLKRLQLLVAHRMREDARSIVSEIPNDVQPTRLILTEAKIIRVESEDTTQLPPGEEVVKAARRTEVVVGSSGSLDAWMISKGYVETLPTVPPTLIYSPTFVDRSGIIWKAPRHEVKDQAVNYITLESIKNHIAGYRSMMRGAELEGKAQRYGPNVVSNSPRLATDDDLLPLENLSLSQLEGEVPEKLATFRKDLLGIVELV